MKTASRRLAFWILIFNGLTACFGGLLLLIKPDGSALGMSIELLNHSPFTSFFIPGIILFTVIGLFSLWVSWLVLRNHEYAIPLIFVQGCLLLGWIIIQIILIQSLNYLHLVYGASGLLLIISALMLSRKGVVT